MERDLSLRPSSRTSAVIWLRKTHGWIGLWGATLGLLFGTSGIWLNHRAVLPLQPAIERSNLQLALPEPAPTDPRVLATWLRGTLQIDAPAANIRVEPARPVAWAQGSDRHGSDGAALRSSGVSATARGGDAERTRTRDRSPDREREVRAPLAIASAPVAASASTSAAALRAAHAAPGAAATHARTAKAARASAAHPASAAMAAGAAASGAAAASLMQPEHWTISFGGPKASVQADYWVGNRSVSVRRTESGFIGTLMNLHKGVGMPVPWILLVDTLAGSLILLSLSGLALWTLTHRRRVVGLAIFGTALAVTAGLALSHL